MAYASLVSLQHTADLILNNHKYSISVDEIESISSIREYANFLTSFLENYPEKATRLEGKIRDLANEAENLIEDFMWKINRFQMCQIVELSRGEFKRRLKRVREDLGTITGDLMDDQPVHLPAAAISSSRVAATVKNDAVIGLDEDLFALKDRLCGSSKLDVIPIVGMGGIGKTTFARYAYDDQLISEHFHVRAFVQVSQNYIAKVVLTNLLASVMSNEVCESLKGLNLFESEVYGSLKGLNLSKEQIIGEMNESDIKTKVYKSLKGRRYLIVMDDIWSTEAWDDVRNIFPDDDNGSRIMLTTRLSDVAAYASGGSPLHEMKLMDENQSWDLIRQKVFTESQDCPPELEDIGKEVARGCSGMPLAVVLVAGALSTTTKTRASWEKIARNVNSVVDGQLDEILSLSYTLLPHHLRPCFLFIAGFPEDYKIRAWRLINLWVAEGFLKHESGSKSLEEVAEECLEDLVKRNLVLVSSWKSNGKIKSCSLHDLVRDMCVRRAQEEKFLLMDRCALPDERRVSVVHSDLNEIWGPTIHTILCFRTRGLSLPESLVKFRLLRVLDMYDDPSWFLHIVFELFHLRYLALPFAVGEFPPNILKLQNLQTLIIHSDSRFDTPYGQYRKTHYPLEFWRMPHLRHLVITPYYRTLPYPPDGSTLPLENLQTLSGVARFACRKKNLKMIPNLKKFVFSTNEQYCNLCNLVNLHQLEKLTIVLSSEGENSSLQGRIPSLPRSLKKLVLVGGQLPWKDISIAGSLPNLQVLKLKNDACNGDTWETTNGGFPELKFLLIECSNLQHWKTEADHFPRLKCLVLQWCENLQEIPESIGEIPTLEVIKVDNLNESLVDSAKQIQEDQHDYGNDAFQVHVIQAEEKTTPMVNRHSKVLTSKGLRDRRVRLSVYTAIEFYDLQDRLGYDQPSKAVVWLLKAAAPFPDAHKQMSNDKRSSTGFDSAELDLGDPSQKKKKTPMVDWLSKVLTSKGLRDQRVRLSVNTAIEFYDLHDRLGYDQPSKTVEWLLKAAATSIAELPPMNTPFPDTPKQMSDDKRSSTGFDSAELDLGDSKQVMKSSACSSNSETSKGSGLSLSRSESWIKACERAKERVAEKEKGIKENDTLNPISQTTSFTELLNGGTNSGTTTTNEANLFLKSPWQ